MSPENPRCTGCDAELFPGWPAETGWHNEGFCGPACYLKYRKGFILDRLPNSWPNYLSLIERAIDELGPASLPENVRATCSTCLYFHQADLPPGEKFGDCRFNPPVAFRHGSPTNDPPNADFPVVWDDDWCGQHRPRT